MANTVSAALFPEMWPARIQTNLTKSLVALEVCDTSLEADLKYGDKLHFPYIGALSATPYTPGTAFTPQDFTATDDTIEINHFKIVPFYFYDINLLQSHQNYAANVADDAAYQLRDAIDATALDMVDAGVMFGDTSGTAGTYITGTSETVTAVAASSSNIDDVFVYGRKALREENVSEDGDWIAVMEPGVASVIELLAIDKGFNVADATLRNGYAGDFLGFHCYVSNNMKTDHMYLGKRGGISLVVQKEPSMKITDVSDKLGSNFVPSIVYGATVFTRNAKRFLDVQISS